MVEKSVREKVLRAARKVLAVDSQRRSESESTQLPSNYVTRSSTRAHTLPARFPFPKPSKLKHRIAQPTQLVDTNNLSLFPFRFSDLPLEVLQHIFLCCTEPRVEGSLPYHKFCPEWLPITQVCRSWRVVTHNYPPLWTIITSNLNVFWADIMQQRSKPLSLDVHLRVGRRDIDDREVWMSTYNAMVILRFISQRIQTLRLDGPRENIQSILSTLRTPSPLQSLSINIPLWDLGAPFSIPEAVFAFSAPVRSLTFSADRALRAPSWLLRGLTSFTTGGRVLLLDLLDALREMPILEYFTLLNCNTVWNEDDVPPGVPISMDKLEVFVVRADSPRHFVLLAMHLGMPETARKRLVVRTLAAPGWGFWARWFEALPPLYASRGGLQDIHISGGPTRGRFCVWTDGLYDDMARFCFELEWHGSPPAPDGVRAIELTSPFYRLHTLCDELKAADVRRVIVEGDPAHVVVPEGYWHQLLGRLPAVEELWLHPGTAEVLRSACAPQDEDGYILQSLKRVYVIEGRLSAPKLATPDIACASGSNLDEIMTVAISSSDPSPDSLVSLQSRDWPVEAQDEGRKKVEVPSLDVRPGLMALLRGRAAQPREVHLRNCEIEDDVLQLLCAVAKVRKDSDWVLVGI